MSNKQWTFESVDAHIQAFDLDQMEKNLATVDSTNIIEKVCGIYKVAKPILELVSKVLPPKWKRAVRFLISVLDSICKS